MDDAPTLHVHVYIRTLRLARRASRSADFSAVSLSDLEIEDTYSADFSVGFRNWIHTHQELISMAQTSTVMP